ncbi:hypothetical protein D9619_000529 [Psilocybe cf. subviscida]|uniref:DM34 domain-containing protein n=1 Tax=Psilocybe cf. subviscida TaxID=2480587 RepID=A0A8H5F392_9AGAR|nr:hypothetical protein D9619_000529 [Psilocybe cf. subviscida]
MSFTFNWPRFSDQFHYDVIQMLNTRQTNLRSSDWKCGPADILRFIAPRTQHRDLTVDQFCGIFRMTGATLSRPKSRCLPTRLLSKTKTLRRYSRQILGKSLNHKQPYIHFMGSSGRVLAAKQPLVVPMFLCLSHFCLSSQTVLVVSKQKGITPVFKTDPPQDSIVIIQNFI